MTEGTQTAPPDDPRSLSKRASSAAGWVVGARIFQQVLAIGRILVLARLLTPGDFGLMGVAVSALTVTQLFSNTGMRGALVQRRGDISGALNTAWTIEFIRVVLIAAIIFAAASPIARLFDTPDATQILQAIAAIFTISAFNNIATVYLRKELRIRDELWIKLGSTVVEAVVTIILALTLGSVWALVWGGLARGATQLGISYIVCPYMPRFEFKKSEAAWMFRFGRWMSVSGVAAQLMHQVDRLIIARILGTTALGLYTISDRLSLHAVREMGQVGVRVGFPALAKIQGQKEEFARKSVATLELSLAIVVPISVASFILVDSIVPVVLGEQWIGAIDVTRMMALAAIAMTIAEVGSVPLVAFGIPRLAAVSTVVALIVMLISLPLLANHMDLQGAGLAILIAHSSAGLIILAFWVRRLGVRIRSLLQATITPLVLAATVAPPLLVIDSTDWSDTIKTFAGGGVFAAIYGITSIGIWIVARRGLLQVVFAATSRGRVAAGRA